MLTNYRTTKTSIVVISDMKNYFFSTNHCQDHNLGDDFIPCTFSIPMFVEPRESCPTGIITNKEELKKVMFYDEIEIPNPDKNFQG